MEIILTTAVSLIFSIAFFIVYELFKQLCVFLWVYTHPQYDKFIRILGATIEGVSISIVGAAVYQWFLDDKVVVYALCFGIIWIMIGVILKDYNRK
jgi:hypothetical protein